MPNQLEPGQELWLTVLSTDAPAICGHVIDVTDPQVRIRVNAQLPFAAPVKVEAANMMLLGDICHCESSADGFVVGVTARHRFTTLPELARLNRLLVEESRAPSMSELRSR